MLKYLFRNIKCREPLTTPGKKKLISSKTKKFIPKYWNIWITKYINKQLYETQSHAITWYFFKPTKKLYELNWNKRFFTIFVKSHPWTQNVPW